MRNVDFNSLVGAELDSKAFAFDSFAKFVFGLPESRQKEVWDSVEYIDVEPYIIRKQSQMSNAKQLETGDVLIRETSWSTEEYTVTAATETEATLKDGRVIAQPFIAGIIANDDWQAYWDLRQ